MFEYYFTFRAVTPAQSARNVLHSGGVAAAIGRAPRQLSMQGCGYVLRVAPQAGLRALSSAARQPSAPARRSASEAPRR